MKKTIIYLFIIFCWTQVFAVEQLKKKPDCQASITVCILVAELTKSPFKAQSYLDTQHNLTLTKSASCHTM